MEKDPNAAHGARLGIGALAVALVVIVRDRSRGAARHPGWCAAGASRSHAERVALGVKIGVASSMAATVVRLAVLVTGRCW